MMGFDFMGEKIRESWENFLNPEILRSNLIVASIFLSAFEILKECILERPKEMYINGFNESGLIVDESYKLKVLSLDKSPIYASLEWLKKCNVINQKDIDAFTRIKKCRNELAHELPKLITEGIKNDPVSNFKSILDLLEKIERWWVCNVTIPTNPEFNDTEVGAKEILLGKVITIHMLTDIALGNDEKSWFYYEEIVRKNAL